MQPVDWTAQLVDQIEFYWQATLRPRLRGLTDAECWWEPVADCWSVREVSVGFLPDTGWPPPDPPPVTTIAWRLAHIAGPTLATRASRHFGEGSFDPSAPVYPGTAAGMVGFLSRSYDAWVDGLRRVPSAELTRPCGEPGYEHEPLATLVLHIHREVFHHGGEIGVLRDLYRAGLR